MGAQTIIPASILTNVDMGSPVILAGGDLTIIHNSIPSNVVVGVIPKPAFGTSGTRGIMLFIGGALCNYLVPGGLTWPRQGSGQAGGGTGAATGGNLTITQTVIGRATMSFDLFVGDGSGFVPQVSQIVSLSENNVTIFAGCIKAASSDPAPGYGLTSDSPIGFHVDCVDKSSICDNRVVIKTYPAGADVAGVILDIVSNFLNGEGITTQGVNITDNLDSAMVFNTITVSNAFDQLATLTGATWWVDFNGVLNFLVIQSAPAAPFDLAADTANVIGSSFRNFVSTQTLTGYANKFYAISNLVVLPGGASGENAGGSITSLVVSVEGTGYGIGDNLSIPGGNGDAVMQVTSVSVSGGVTGFSLTNAGTGYQTGVQNPTDITGTGTGLVVTINAVSPSPQTGAGGVARTEMYVFENDSGQPFQHAAWLAGLGPGYVLLDLPIGALISVVDAGVSIPVYPLSGGFQPGPGYYWFDQDAYSAVIFPAGFEPDIGDTIVIQYVPSYRNSTVQGASPLTNTCGSGLVEGVIQVPNIDVQSQLDAIASAFLAAHGQSIPVLVSYESDEPGLVVGQQQNVNLPLVGLSGSVIYLTSVTLSVDATGNEGAAQLPSGSAFRTVVEASTINASLGNWITWLERFIARTNFLLPLPRYEQAIAVLASGGSLTAADPVATDAYEAKNAGLVFAVSANAVTAPTGQNLLLQWYVNGNALLTSPLVIPSGVTDIVYANAQIPAGFAIYKGDLFTCSAAYQITSASPVTPAGSVSFYCDWSY
jgi:hypothetical protein